MTAAELLVEARNRSGLSRTALARRAGVPTSTVSRIESGQVDATITMLERLLAASGRRLVLRSHDARRVALASLSNAWSPSSSGDDIDWTRLRATVDYLLQHPDELETGIADPPPRSGSARLDNLLAAVAEKLADEAGLARPRWCATVPVLDQPWCSSGTPRMAASAQASAPEQFRRRGILLSGGELWRDHATSTPAS
jgi:Predicted transcriptional regulator with C-terminal CBS domains